MRLLPILLGVILLSSLAQAQIYVTGGSPDISEYSTTGSLLNSDFITLSSSTYDTAIPANLSILNGVIYLDGTTPPNAYSKQIQTYNATTGALINNDLAFYTNAGGTPTPDAVSGGYLYAVTGYGSGGQGSLLKYNATTGALVSTISLYDYLTEGITSVNGNAYVAMNGSTDGIYEVNGATNAISRVVTTASNGMTIIGNNIFFSLGNYVQEYTLGGTLENAEFLALTNPGELQTDGTSLFVSYSSGGQNVVGDFNATTGASINADLFSMSGYAFYVAQNTATATPEPRSWAMGGIVLCLLGWLRFRPKLICSD